MKTKTFRNGSASCKSYCKKVGNGWEVGFTYGKKLVFVGNFIHTSEANRWFSIMNTEIRAFARRYTVGKTYNKTWFAKFLGAQLYRKYYSFLSQTFTTYNRNWSRAVTTDTRKYRRMSRGWSSGERTPFLKAA